jgi:hypothetical protein
MLMSLDSSARNVSCEEYRGGAETRLRDDLKVWLSTVDAGIPSSSGTRSALHPDNTLCIM